MLQPSLPNSIATVRPSPVAPPLMMTTFPVNPPCATSCAWGCSSTAPAPAGRAAARRHEGGSKPEVGMTRRSYGSPQGAASQRGMEQAHAAPYIESMKRLPWIAVGIVGALAWGVIALKRGETISAAWLVLAAVGTYLVGYRFYARFLANKVLGIDPRRATPAERLNNGRDFVPTTRWVLFGHHFAAIAGAGPLVGPVLAAQFGYLPSTIWIVFGVVLGGAVQDFVILFGSMRRDGKSLGQMAKEEIGPITGLFAMVAILAIMIILLAVLALVVTNALKDSPWGIFSILCTIPIALGMGIWMRVIRPGKTIEATVVGIVLLILALIGGRYVAQSATLAPLFTHGGLTIAWGLMIYGFIASVLPVWLLLAPRDYLSTFMKLGT